MIDSKLSKASLERGLGTRFLGKKVFYYPVVGSTNDVAKELAKKGASEGTLVIADEQMAGRGRLGRRWLAPPASSLLMSLIFRPELAPSQTQRLTMLCSLAVAEAVEEITGLAVELKWPNDILVNRRKIGGILTELGVEGGRLAYAVVGMGLNVNFDIAEVPELQGATWSATSLAIELGHEVSRLELLWRILERMEGRYERLRAGEVPNEEWARRLVTLENWVVVTTLQGKIEGFAEGVDTDGALLLRLANGESQRILAGDATLKL